ncbi:carbonic anhydrase [Aurantiacibacter gangjinensis]|uniref:Carbonic anhydrase n=1 Tax=Aurantiacibacter gangjinensis TaxID=502682 RepID=A0A0G9MQK7_9SPHN|nr:carbonic anhydrase [Aurantiacibacter gangjinensis]APE28690.1 Carbonic anhydrase [Aurantiacibacter gangjinensis]KLE32854.1 carbonate dehydratase [Aurantiacibacter gangjinensis]
MPEFDELMRGYGRFRASGYPRQRERYEKLVAEGQHPGLMVISCSDSRVDPAQIFDVDPGEIFVVRNIAALVPPASAEPSRDGVSAALEYAVTMLEVRQIVVMGHGMCGGCKAALTQELRDAKPGEGGYVGDWVRLLDGAREGVIAEHGESGPDAERAMELAAVRQSLANLRSFDFVRHRLDSGSLKLHGTFFALSEGTLYHLEDGSDAFEPVG